MAEKDYLVEVRLKHVPPQEGVVFRWFLWCIVAEHINSGSCSTNLNDIKIYLDGVEIPAPGECKDDE
jgi:hypothetical protein